MTANSPGERDVRRVRDRLVGLPRSGRELSLSLLGVGTLRKAGWLDADSKVPWLTYPCQRFLDALHTADLTCLEFGSGASTGWLNARFASVRSIEHDPAWHARTAAMGREVLLRPTEADTYTGAHDCDYLTAGRSENPWDVVLIDGMARITCVELIDDYLAVEGLLVLDDTDLPRLRAAAGQLRARGFVGIDFWGLRPGSGLETCTSVFTRDMNRWLRRIP